MANTIGTSTLSETWRIGYAQNMLDLSLKTALVTEKIAHVDRSGAKYIGNPYLTALTATAAAIDGTYTPATATTTDQTLTVSDQATSSVHLLEFEDRLNRVDLFASLVEEMRAQVAVKMDSYVINYFTNNAGSTYSTPTGGFTTASNIPTIIANCTGKVAGYAQDFVSQRMFIVIESTDLPGFIISGMQSGFNYSDSTLNNGFGGVYGAVRVYVVRPGTFATTTIGTLSATNSGKRLFGIEGVHWVSNPGGMQYDEKKITSKTGRELVCWANYGAAVWTQKSTLLCAITIT